MGHRRGGCRRNPGVVEHPDLQLVGCWVHSPAKNGRDAGELAGIGPIGVAATSSVEEILDADADAVIYAPLPPDSQQVAAILRSGKNVITPVGWFYPRESEAAPLGGRPRWRAALPCTAPESPPAGSVTSSCCSCPRCPPGSVLFGPRSFRICAATWPPDVLRHVMGFGGAPEEALGGMMQKLLDGGFIQAINLVVDELGFAADPRILAANRLRPTAPIDSPIGVIEPGQVAARRFTWEALVDGQPVVQVSVKQTKKNENNFNQTRQREWKRSSKHMRSRYIIQQNENGDKIGTHYGFLKPDTDAGRYVQPVRTYRQTAIYLFCRRMYPH